MSLPIDLLSDAVLDPFPYLPFDVKEKILYFYLYKGSEFSPFLQEDDLTGFVPDVVQRQADFARLFLTADKATHLLASKLLSLSLFVSSEQDLARLMLLSDRRVTPHLSPTFGSLTKRLEIWTHSLNASLVVPLLERLPNLQIFVVRTFWRRFGLPSSSMVQGALSHSLITHNPNLLRVQIESDREFSTPSFLRSLLVGLPRLVTLRAAYVVEQDIPLPSSPLSRPIDALRELSVGTGPTFEENESRHRTPGDVLRLFPSVSTLPLLESLHIEGPIPSTRDFLSIFGPHIRTLSVACLDADFVQGSPAQPHLVDLCPELEELIVLCQQGTSPALINHIPNTDTITRVVLVFIPRIRVSTWGSYTVLRHALRFGCIYGQSRLNEVCIMADRGSRISIGKMAWFTQYRDYLHALDIDVTGIPTYFPEY